MIDWGKVPGEVITVISDLHANKRAVKAALENAKRKRTDQLIILGDILTYGLDTTEVMDMVSSVLEAGAWLLQGNHDEIYLNLIDGTDNRFVCLGPDVRESITYNMTKMDVKQFTSWKWQKEIVHNNVYFSHANPYGNCWEYIKSLEDFKMAGSRLKDLQHLAGIFGHTHRSSQFSLKSGMLPSMGGLREDTFVINPGSIGQPRGKPPQATLLRLCSHQNRLWAEVEPVQFDMKAHMEDLQRSSLSPFTKASLLSFFEE